MDQRVIHSLNAKYHKYVVCQIIWIIEKNETLLKDLLLQRMELLVEARDPLTTRAIVNCFWTSEIFTESKEADEDDTPFQELQDEIDNFCSVQPDLIPEIFFSVNNSLTQKVKSET